ncbi:MFS transporter [Candidatus Bathyarchaeota archaeon]|nr:MFS transporter [Candidatus Bathyarchaeota archaeon]
MVDEMEKSKDRLLKSLYLTNFLSSLAFGTLIYLLPVYAEGLGASYYDLGVIGGVGNAVYTISTLVTGFLLDTFERTRFYAISCILGVVSLLLFSQANSVSTIILLRGLLGGVSAAFWVATSTLIADTSPPELLTRSMARYNVSWITAFAVGPFLGGMISEAFGFPVLFTMMSTVSMVSFVVILVYVRPNHESEKRGSNTRFSYRALRNLFYVYAALIPYALVLGVYMAILPGHMKALGITTAMVGLLITASNGFRGLGFLFAERFVAWGVKKSLALASVLLFVALLLVAFSQGVTGFLLPMVLFGFAGGIITPVILDCVAGGTHSDTLGAALGTHEAIYGLGMCLGPIAGGVFAEAFQPTALYLTLATLSLLILPVSRAIGKGSAKTQLELRDSYK